MVSTFDRTASAFDQHRSFPVGIPEAIREAIWKITGKPASVWLLDLGAGTGRIGKVFRAAGDSYVGVDLSFPMLREFRKDDSEALLAQADGAQLPFPDKTFGVVLLLQVLSGASDWRAILNEARRVLLPEGAVVVGHMVTPPDGIDGTLKDRLKLILKEMGASSHESMQSRKKAREWLESTCASHRQAVAATWAVQRSANDFIVRHKTGARFAALPPQIQADALERLSRWAKANLGPLDKSFAEQHKFELDIFHGRK